MMIMCLSLAFVMGASACSSCASCGGTTGDISSESSSDQEQSSPTSGDNSSESSSDQEQSSPTSDDNSSESSSTPDDGTSSSVGDSDDSSVGGGDDVTKTNEEIFAEIKAAVLATQNYNGDITIDLLGEYGSGDDGRIAEAFLTWKPATGQTAFYEGNGKNGYYAKLFEKDGKYYEYAADSEDNEKICNEIAKEDYDSYVNDLGDEFLPSYMLQHYGSFAIADTYEELCDAYEIVAADSMAQLEENLVNPKADYEIELSYKEGKSEIFLTLNCSCDGDSDDATAKRQVSMTMKFVAENGRVKRIEQVMSSESEDENYDSVERYTYEYTYSFDQEFYDSIIPCASTPKTGYDFEVVLHYSPEITYEIWQSITAETTAQDILDYVNEIYWVADHLTDLNLEMDAWYLDEACTVKFDPSTITDLVEYEKIKHLYAKSFSFNEEKYALAVFKSEVECQYSKPYQIANMSIGRRGAKSQSAQFVYANQPYTLPTADKVLVNGEVVTTENVTLEGGKTYVITQVYFEKDGDYCIFPLG